MHSHSFSKVWKTTWCLSPGEILCQSVTYNLRAQSCPCVKWKEPGSPVSLLSLRNGCHTMNTAPSVDKVTALNGVGYIGVDSRQQFICYKSDMHAYVHVCGSMRIAYICFIVCVQHRISCRLQGNISNPEALQWGLWESMHSWWISPLLRRRTVRQTETKGQQEQTCQIWKGSFMELKTWGTVEAPFQEEHNALRCTTIFLL